MDEKFTKIYHATVKCHFGYGFGIKVAPLNRIVILENLSFGEKGMLPLIPLRFQF